MATAIDPPGSPPAAGPAASSAPRRRWFRRAPQAIATSTVCPSCRQAGPAKLLPGESCAQCQSQAAWTAHGSAGLKIDRAAIEAAVERRRGEAAGEPLWRRLARWAPALLSIAVAAAAALAVRALLAPRPIGPLARLLDDLRDASRQATLVGAAALVLGVILLLRLRGQRHYRRMPLVVAHAGAIIAGGAASLIGGLHWSASASGYRGQYTSMPPRTTLAVTASAERILNATVVVLAPDRDGDARGMAIGTGAIVATEPHRAWVVTCSHVAMPYAPVGAPRSARDAQPVWVQLSDGREARGTVRWTAAPPLDVAVVEVPLADPPAPVTISPDASSLAPGASVMFVPNPYRDGWKVISGELRRREPHRTPAGTYELLYTDLPVIPGDSGSGLFDARGQLVGLNTWTRPGAHGDAEGISLPSETMRTLVDAIARGELDQLDSAQAQPRE
jgi:S1-C subfamily serine protease